MNQSMIIIPNVIPFVYSFRKGLLKYERKIHDITTNLLQKFLT